MTVHESREFETDSEISLLDIVVFLKSAWKTITIMGVVGILGSIIFLMVTPKQYEAIAQVRMAQVSLPNPASPFGAVIEDPASLILRMQFATNYDEATILACGYKNMLGAPEGLAKSLKFSIPKGLLGAVELKVAAPSTEQAKDCANAVVMRIAYLQAEFARPFIDEAKLKLAQDNERIEQARRLIIKADQSGQAISAAYLSARDEVSYFLTDREKMIDLINSAKERGTRLVSPIYTSERPVSPKKTVSLVAGFAAGLFLGLLIALIRKDLPKLRLAMKKVECRRDVG
jgi:LPS O-antigen subunit length determinant protein (WzzB/FepE family)